MVEEDDSCLGVPQDMIDLVRWFTSSTDNVGTSQKRPRIDSSGYLWSHGANGFYVYRADGPDLIGPLASDLTRTSCWGSIQLGSYVHMVTANNGVNAYSWDGTTLTRITSAAYGTVAICTDGTYIYTGGARKVHKLSFDGSTYTLVATYTHETSTNIYDMVHLGGYLWMPDYGLDRLRRQAVAITAAGSYYETSGYTPEQVCTDGTYVYTDNTYPNSGSVWKFQAGVGTTITKVASGGDSAYYDNTRGVCWDATRSYVVVSGLLNDVVKAYSTSLVKVAESLARDNGESNRGCSAANGYIYDTTDGVTVWGYGDTNGQSGSRAQAVWTTP